MINGRVGWRNSVWLIALLWLGPVGAVERELRIEAPASVVAGQSFTAVITARTDAGQGEQVGFLHAEWSVDGGKTWKPIFYLERAGPRVTQPASLTPGSAGSTVKLRVRAAFRDGLAGDVDYNGAALRWHESWAEWREPAARHASLVVTAR